MSTFLIARVHSVVSLNNISANSGLWNHLPALCLSYSSPLWSLWMQFDPLHNYFAHLFVVFAYHLILCHVSPIRIYKWPVSFEIYAHHMVQSCGGEFASDMSRGCATKSSTEIKVYIFWLVLPVKWVRPYAGRFFLAISNFPHSWKNIWTIEIINYWGLYDF